MRTLVLCLIVGLSSCASQAPNPWESIEVPRGTITQPIELGKFPQPSQSDSKRAVYGIEGVNALEVYRLKAEGNTVVAAAHAEQIEALRKGIEGLVEAGKAQRRIADMRQEILEEERRHWLYERIGYWSAFLLIGTSLL